MRQLRRVMFGVMLGAAAAASGGTAAAGGGAPPSVLSVIEGRDSGADRPVLVLIGKSLTKFTSYALSDPLGQRADETPQVLLRSKGMVVLGLAPDLPAGAYVLAGNFGRQGKLSFPVKVGNGSPLPGVVAGPALAGALRTDLDDADTLAGQTASSYRDAANLTAGTLSTDRFSAFADLGVENRFGTASGQIAAGDHAHDARYPLRSELDAAGTLNAAANPVEWTQLKNVPAGFADGVDSDPQYGAGAGLALAAGSFAVQFGGTGAAATAARSDHDHDARHPLRTDLSGAGTLNNAANPMDWTKLKSVPAGFADGADNDTSYAAGTGLSLSGTTFSVSSVGWGLLTGVPSGFADGLDNDTTYSAGTGLALAGGAFSLSFGGTGAATNVARSDHDHDARHPLRTDLSAAGTLNNAANPMDWTKLRSVPAGFADGIDTDTTYSAGNGLSLSGTTFSVGFAGTGAANTAARSDHNHSLSYVRLDGGNTMTGRLSVSSNDGVLFGGNFGSGTLAATGAGTRLVWYPGKAAFRAGRVSGTQWDDANVANVGYDSTAMGYDTIARGTASTAMGDSTTASGTRSTSMGSGTIASGNYSTAMGVASTAQAFGSVVLGQYNVIAGTTDSWVATDPVLVVGNGSYNTPSNALTLLKNGDMTMTGRLSVSSNDGVLFGGNFGSGTLAAPGAGPRLVWYPRKAAFRAGYVDGTQWDDDNTANANIGTVSTAMGYDTIASAAYSTAMGYRTTASGDFSTAMGGQTIASGYGSTAMGYFTAAQAYCSVALGQYNTVGGTTNSWVSGDPVLVVGNGTGTSSSQRSNALTLLKNGSLTIAGSMTASAYNTTSDARLKTDIEPLRDVLARLDLVRGVSYRFKDEASGPAGRQIGLLAQEVKEAFPDLVHEDPDGKLSVAYGNFTAVLLAAVKEQQREIDGQKREIVTLRAELNGRLARVEALLGERGAEGSK